jgi:hypothetical protein
MYIKIGLWTVWLCFITYAFLLAPPQDANTFELIKNLSLGNWQGINPLIIALFNLMGILPIVYTCLLLIDGRGQKIRAWGFALGSFGLGAFALLPYLALRQPQTEFTGEKDWIVKIIDSRITGFIIALVALIILGLGLTKGDWGDFIVQWQNSRFINVMSLDFCLLSLLAPILIKDDLAKRLGQDNSPLWLVSIIPFFGALIYLCLRPPLTVSSQ